MYHLKNYLRIAAALFALLLPVCINATQVEVIQNGGFESGLTGWTVEQDVSEWPTLQVVNSNTRFSLHPSKGYRGPLLSQNLNVSNIANGSVEVSVKLLSQDNFMTCGQSVAGYITYVTNTGAFRDVRLFTQLDCEIFNLNGAPIVKTVALPSDAAKLVRFSLYRIDLYGQIDADDISVKVPNAAVVGAIPAVTGISSTNGTYGQSLTITGTNFGNNGSGNGRVTIGGAPAGTITGWTPTQVVVTLAAPATTGLVRVIADNVESVGTHSFTINSPHFKVELPKGASHVIKGQPAVIPIGLKFNNGFTTGSGVSFSATSTPSVPISFNGITSTRPGGTVMTVQTGTLSQGDYRINVSATAPSAGTYTGSVMLRVSQVGTIEFWSNDETNQNYGLRTSLTRIQQGEFSIETRYKDLNGDEIRGVPDKGRLTFSSSNPSSLLIADTHDSYKRFFANSNGSGTISVASPDGVNHSIPFTVNFPVNPSYTLLTLTPSTANVGGSSSVAVAIEANSFADNFPINFPGNLNGSYSNGGLRYDGTGTISDWNGIGVGLVTVGNGPTRAALLNLINDPTKGLVKGLLHGIDPPDQSNGSGPQASLTLVDSVSEAVIKSTGAWQWTKGVPAEFTFTNVPPGNYKLKMVPNDPANPPYNLTQWYPNAYSFSDASVINVTAGGTAQNLNLFYTQSPKANPQVVGILPADSSTDVATNIPITVTFDVAMDDLPFIYSNKAFRVEDNFGNEVSGQRQMSNNNQSVTFTADNPFNQNETYTVKLTTYGYSQDGLHLAADVQYSFTTGTGTLQPLQVTGTYPQSNSFSISTNSVVMVEFNHEINPATVDSNSIIVEDTSFNQPGGDVTVAGNRIFFTPYWLDWDTEYNVRVASNVGAVNGALLGSEYSFTFTTGPGVSDPLVIATSPANNASGVDENTTITVWFNQPMYQPSIDTNTFLVMDDNSNPVSGSVSTSTFSAVFTPDNPLSSDMGYTATLTTSIESDYGYFLPTDYSWSFTTADVSPDAPQLVAVYPWEASTDSSPNTAIMVQFDRDMDMDSVFSNSLTLRDEYDNEIFGSVWLDGRVLVMQPDIALDSNLHTVTLSGDVRSKTGVPVGSNVSWSFTPASFDPGPRVVFTIPGSGQTGVSTNTTVKAYFDQPMAWWTINDLNFYVEDSSFNQVSGNVYMDYNNSAELVPWSSLDEFETYTATLTDDIQSSNYSSLNGNYSWSFTTGATPLVVSYTGPYDGETDVSTNIDIYISFEEEIDSNTASSSTILLKDANQNLVPASLSVFGSSVYIYPNQPLLPDTRYSVTITTGVESTFGKTLIEPFVFVFTTGSGGVEIDYTTPGEWFEGWFLDKNIDVWFQSEVNPSTLNSGTFLLTGPGGVPVAGTVYAYNFSATFDPAAPLLPNTEYTATLTTGVQTIYGAPLANDYSWTFTTAANANNTIGSVRQLPLGTRVALSEKVMHYVSSDRAYIGELDRSAGIKVNGFFSGQEGGRMSVSGTVQVDGNGEKYIVWSWLSTGIGTPTIIPPVKTVNRTVKERLMDSLKVRVSGIVTSIVDANTVIINDGSDNDGLIVKRQTGAISAAVGTHIRVTGAAGWGGSRTIWAQEITQLAP